MTLREYLDNCLPKMSDEKKDAIICWGARLLSGKIMSCEGEPPHITPDTVIIEMPDGGQDIQLTISDGDLDLNYMSPDDVYDKNSALFSVGMVLYEAKCGKTLFEAENVPVEMLPIIAEESDRAAFARENDIGSGILAGVIAKLTSWRPEERTQAIAMIDNIINEEFNCEVHVQFIKNGMTHSDRTLLLEEIGEKANLKECIPDGENVADMPDDIEFRPWPINISVNLEASAETVKKVTPDIGILVCEGESTVPDIFVPVGSTDDTSFRKDMDWTLFDGEKNELIIYMRDAGCQDMVSTFDYPEHLWCVGSIELPCPSKDVACKLSVEFNKTGTDTYSVVCRLSGYNDFDGKTCIKVWSDGDDE